MNEGQRTPWKNYDQPFLSLSNFQLESDSKTQLIKQNQGDRFLASPNIRVKLNFDLEKSSSENQDARNILPSIGSSKNSYQQFLNKSLRNQTSKKESSSMIYSSKHSREGYLGLYDNFLNEKLEQTTKFRAFPKTAYKILNAPKLKDDFYTSLLDWSKNDMIAVVLDNAAYAWPSKSNDAEKIVEGFISSLKWAKAGLVLGEETGRIRVVDVEKKMETLRVKHHLGRVGVMDVSASGNEVATGSKDNDMVIFDIRDKQSARHFKGHKQQICGLKWSYDCNFLATGSNDNLVHIWDQRMNKSIGKLEGHVAAVKALAWSPHKSSLLGTGGGSTDKSIRFWNTIEMECVKVCETGSQVCNMTFSCSTDEVVSTHGYSQNSIMVWSGKDMRKLATLQGHSYRVLYLATSPDSETILTGSGDQTLRFWKLFPSSGNCSQSENSLTFNQIR